MLWRVACMLYHLDGRPGCSLQSDVPTIKAQYHVDLKKHTITIELEQIGRKLDNVSSRCFLRSKPALNMRAAGAAENRRARRRELQGVCGHARQPQVQLDQISGQPE